MIGVRAAEPEDAAAVAGVHVRSWQAAYRGLLPDEYLDGLRPEDRMVRYRFDSPDPDDPHTVVVTEAGAILGFVTCGQTADADAAPAGEILALYVDPDVWGRGLGSMLIGQARGRLADRGFSQAILWVLAGNHRAMRFYQLDRWAPDERRREVDVWGVLVEEVRYRRRLP